MLKVILKNDTARGRCHSKKDINRTSSVLMAVCKKKSSVNVFNLSLCLTASLSRNIALEKHSKNKIPPHFWETPLIFGKPFPGPKRVTDMTPKKSLALKYIDPPFFCKKTGPIWYSLASAASFLIYPSVYGVTTLCYISIPR